jgi:hypothetical protein
VKEYAFIRDPRRGAAATDLSRALSILVAVEDMLLDSNDPVALEALLRVSIAIKNLEQVRL